MAQPETDSTNKTRRAGAGRPVVDPSTGARTAGLNMRVAPVTKDGYKKEAKEQGVTLATWVLTELDYALANNSPGCHAKLSQDTNTWVEVCNKLIRLTVELSKHVADENEDEAAVLRGRIDALRKERERLEAGM